MSFDVFNDFEQRGYLRNSHALKDPSEIKRIEHFQFQKNARTAFDFLSKTKPLDYESILEIHRILFKDFYPWAGKDRLELTPKLNITKGDLENIFAYPDDIRLAANYALDKGNNRAIMAQKPGEVFGLLAHAHPFLEGNGRTLLLVHSVLAERANISINCKKIETNEFFKGFNTRIRSAQKQIS